MKEAFCLVLLRIRLFTTVTRVGNIKILHEMCNFGQTRLGGPLEFGYALKP